MILFAHLFAAAVVQMDPFTVAPTSGSGYVAGNGATALKTNEPLMDVPQSVEVMSRDLIDDIGNTNTTDTLQFFGVGDGFAGESNAIRGVGVSFAYVDDMPENQFAEDNAMVDSYSVLKGPAQVLYLNARLTGLVLRTTKRPMPFRQDILTAQVTDWGQYRFTGDFTGPAGQLGSAQIGYRAVVVGQGGGNWQDNVKDDRKVGFLSLQSTVGNTTVVFTGDYQSITGVAGGRSVLTPGGQLYTGAGRQQTGQLAGGNIHSPSSRYSLSVLQRLSPNWEARVQASDWNLQRYGGTSTAMSLNWATGVEKIQPTLDNIDYSEWTTMADVHGSYHLFGLANQDAFGGAYNDFVTKTETWTTASAAVNLPIANRAAFNAYDTPQWYQYSAPANLGTYSKVGFSEAYWMHTIEAIPDRLELVAGWTWDQVATESVTNLSVVPWNQTDVNVDQFVHRFGVVFKPVPGLSLYALQATSFSPAAGSAVLATGQPAPPQEGKDNEVGFKTSLFGGRLSSDFAYFQMPVNNVLRPGGTNAQGMMVFVPVGSTHEEGVDGDVAFRVAEGWQLVAHFYSGHDRDQTDQPVANTFDNQVSLFTRYDFNSGSALRGLAVGGGLARIGGRWVSTNGLAGVPLPANGVLKAEAGTMVDAFVSYAVTRHLSLRVACDNLLNQAYVYGAQSALQVDPSPPRTWYFSGSLRL